jgi:hypothetical protein
MEKTRAIYTSGDHVEGDLKEAGFVDVQVECVSFDIGNWRGGRSFFPVSS